MKKGFTLIELLAVIVILAIIALIATPIILGIINDAREETDKRSVELYAKGLELAIARKNLTEDFNPSSCKILSDGNAECDGIKLIVDVEGKEKIFGEITLSNGKIEKNDLYIGEKKEETTYAYLDKVKFFQLVYNNNKVNGKTGSLKFVSHITDGDATDLSTNGDGSVKGWYNEADKTLYIGTTASKIKLPADSASLFTDEALYNFHIYINDLVDTSDVTNMSYMFSMQLKKTMVIEGIEKFNTSNVTDMKYMIANKSFTNLNLTSWDLSKVDNINGFFSGVNITDTLDISTWDMKFVIQAFSKGSGDEPATIKKVYVKNDQIRSLIMPSEDNIEEIIVK